MRQFSMAARLLSSGTIPLLAFCLTVVACGDITGVTVVNLAAADTLPRDNGDPRLGFTISRSAVYTGDTIRIQFAYTNSTADSIGMWASGTCLFGLDIFSASGVHVSPVDRICTMDLREWVLGPGGRLSITQTWRADDGVTWIPPGPTDLPPGIYTLVPSIGFSQSKPDILTSTPAIPVSLTGASLRVQVFGRP